MSDQGANRHPETGQFVPAPPTAGQRQERNQGEPPQSTATAVFAEVQAAYASDVDTALSRHVNPGANRG